MKGEHDGAPVRWQGWPEAAGTGADQQMERYVANGKVTISFVHPTDSEQVLTAEVSGTATPKFLVAQLVEAGWLSRAATAGQYKLRDARSGTQLLDETSLAQAGIVDGAVLTVDHATAGASGRSRRE